MVSLWIGLASRLQKEKRTGVDLPTVANGLIDPIRGVNGQPLRNLNGLYTHVSKVPQYHFAV
jgi:hypothetical protein